MKEKLQQAIDRLESLYWELNRNGGPDIEVGCIIRLLEQVRDGAFLDPDDVAVLVPDDEMMYLGADPMQTEPPAMASTARKFVAAWPA